MGGPRWTMVCGSCSDVLDTQKVERKPGADRGQQASGFKRRSEGVRRSHKPPNPH